MEALGLIFRTKGKQKQVISSWAISYGLYHPEYILYRVVLLLCTILFPWIPLWVSLHLFILGVTPSLSSILAFCFPDLVEMVGLSMPVSDEDGTGERGVMKQSRAVQETLEWELGDFWLYLQLWPWASHFLSLSLTFTVWWSDVWGPPPIVLVSNKA